MLATKTIAAIDAALEADGGNLYRHWLQKVLPHFSDIYRQEGDPFRSHLGASVIGGKCAREIWYGFRWTKAPKFPGRILRLFNRGHMEEARIIACLLMIGVEVYQQDSNGDQFRITGVDGHFGGSGDGFAIGIPDLPPGTRCLLEFKTHGEKSFLRLKKDGVYKSKLEHYVQTQCYMRKMGISVALYIGVNKNTDEWYPELISLNTEIADQYLERGEKIIRSRTPPERIGKSVGHWECTYCDYKRICHKVGNEEPDVNCRTCRYSVPALEGKWRCNLHAKDLTKEDQLAACESYEVMET